MARIKPQILLQQSKKKKGPSRISVTTIVLCNLMIAVIVFFLFATYRHWSQRSRDSADTKYSDSESETLFESKKSDIPGYAVLNTSKGTIVVELYKESSPEIVDEFINSCQKGHFNGMLFHHVIKHLAIQAGDNQDVEVTEDWILGGKYHSQPDSSLKHEALMVGIPRGRHGGKGIELFITTAPIPDLNEKLLIFGRVIKGEHVVQEIEEVDTDEHYRPKLPVKINSVILKQKI